MFYKARGFTIVELLIVIVVIGILAAITLVAYNGIQSRARTASVSSGLNQVAKKIALQQVDNPGAYPADKAALLALGVTESESLTYQYSVNNALIPATYCVTATDGNTSYYLNNTTTLTPTSGGCVGHGVGGVEAVTNIATNPSAELDAGWNSNNGAFYPRSWDSTVVRTGTRSIVASNLGASTTLLSLYGVGGNSGNGFAVTGDKTYSAAVYFRAEAANQGRLSASYRLSGVYSSAIYGSWVPGTTDSWTKMTQTFTVPAGADMLRICAFVSSLAVTPAGTKAWVDDAIVNEGANVANYADGSSSSWVWNGSANNSTSTGLML